MPCDHAVHVHVENRYFIVEYNADGDVLRIKQRKKSKPPMSGVYNAPYWQAGTHSLGAGDTLPKRIIAAAQAKTDREDAIFNATP